MPRLPWSHHFQLKFAPYLISHFNFLSTPLLIELVLLASLPQRRSSGVTTCFARLLEPTNLLHPESNCARMNISELPPEVFSDILVEAVRIRGLKRALRLRLVASRCWHLSRNDNTVTDCRLESFNEGLVGALYISNLIGKDHNELSTLMWPWLRPYFERRLLERRTKELPRLHTIRTIAEILVTTRGGDLTYEVLAAQLLQLSARDGRRLRQLFLRSLPVEAFDFPTFVFIAAAYAHDASLVNELSGAYFQSPNDTAFGDPFEAALRANNHDIITLLLASPSSEAHFLKAVALHGRADVLKVVLQRECNSINSWLGESHQLDLRRLATILRTPSVELFEVMVQEISSRRLATLSVELLSGLLHCATGRGWANMVAHLIKRGVPSDEMSRSVKLHPLATACKAGYDDVVQILLDNGAIFRGPEIRYAAQHGHTSTVSILLKSQSEPNPVFTEGCLYAAARKGYADVVRLLLDFGVDPNDGKPAPLLGAVQSEHTGIVRLLVGKGARICQTLRRAQKRTELQSMLELLDELSSCPKHSTGSATVMQT